MLWVMREKQRENGKWSGESSRARACVVHGVIGAWGGAETRGALRAQGTGVTGTGARGVFS